MFLLVATRSPLARAREVHWAAGCMTPPVRWGLLSTAAINDPVLQGCADSQTVEFVAVASRSYDKAREWADARGIPTAHGSYADLLRDDAVEAIYVSLPNSMHVDWAIKALEAGKHVLCEKPLSRHAEDVVAAFAASDRTGKLLVEAFMYRFHSQTEQIRTLIADGVIGPVQLIRAAHTFTMADPENDVRTSPELDGGALLDVGCYCVSAFRLLVGEPDRVLGYAELGSSGTDVAFYGLLIAPNGAVGQFDAAMNLPRRDELEIVGADGVILVPDPWLCRGAPLELRLAGERTQVATSATSPYRAQFEAVSAAIRERGPLEFGRDEAVAQALVIEALRTSSETSVAFPVRTGRERLSLDN